MTRPLAALLSVAMPVSAFASDSVIKSGLDYIRHSGEDGRAMAAYIEKDPVPISWTDLVGNRLGEYRSRKRTQGSKIISDDSHIVLDQSLRSTSPEQVGEVLFHEYVHRAQDMAGGIQDDHRLRHSGKSFDKAMDYVKGHRPRSISRDARSPKSTLRRISFARSPDSDGHGTSAAFTSLRHAAPRGGASRRSMRAFASGRVSHARPASPVARVMRATSGRVVSASMGRSGGVSRGSRSEASSGRRFRAAY